MSHRANIYCGDTIDFNRLERKHIFLHGLSIYYELNSKLLQCNIAINLFEMGTLFSNCVI